MTTTTQAAFKMIYANKLILRSIVETNSREHAPVMSKKFADTHRRRWSTHSGSTYEATGLQETY